MLCVGTAKSLGELSRYLSEGKNLKKKKKRQLIRLNKHILGFKICTAKMKVTFWFIKSEKTSHVLSL